MIVVQIQNVFTINKNKIQRGQAGVTGAGCEPETQHAGRERGQRRRRGWLQSRPSGPSADPSLFPSSSLGILQKCEGLSKGQLGDRATQNTCVEYIPRAKHFIFYFIYDIKATLKDTCPHPTGEKGDLVPGPMSPTSSWGPRPPCPCAGTLSPVTMSQMLASLCVMGREETTSLDYI